MFTHRKIVQQIATPSTFHFIPRRFPPIIYTAPPRKHPVIQQKPAENRPPKRFAHGMQPNVDSSGIFSTLERLKLA